MYSGIWGSMYSGYMDGFYVFRYMCSMHSGKWGSMYSGIWGSMHSGI